MTARGGHNPGTALYGALLAVDVALCVALAVQAVVDVRQLAPRPQVPRWTTYHDGDDCERHDLRRLGDEVRSLDAQMATILADTDWVNTPDDRVPALATRATEIREFIDRCYETGRSW